MTFPLRPPPPAARVPSVSIIVPALNEAPIIGAALARLNLELAACYASPRVRALETARLACASLGVDPVVHEPLSGGFDSGGARELVLGEDDDARVLIVGHEPDLSGIVEALTGARIAMKKGGVAAVRLDGSREELLAVLRPRDLRAIEA